MMVNAKELPTVAGEAAHTPNPIAIKAGEKANKADLAHLRSPIHQLNRNMRCPSDDEDYAGLSLWPM